jgi:thioesterase domain-containing protein
MTPDDAEVTIGRPVSNTQAYIVDEQLRPVPIGAPGELCIGGVGVGRGYLNRPELTAERFVADPFRPGNGRRLYRTGDLARYQPDGRIEFLGRIDQQVKIRGFRIELGEIDAALNAQPQVREAVTVVREDEPGDRRLVAYLVAREGQAPAAHELRAALQQRLPDYMLPSAFVVLDRLPLSPNGKVDRRSLPPPSNGLQPRERSYAAPRTPTEKLLERIWAGVLGLEKVGIHDDFFELGGHSLNAAVLVERIRRRTGEAVPLTTLLREPNIAALAQHLGEAYPGDYDLLEPVRTSGSQAAVVWFGHGMQHVLTGLPTDHPLYWCKPEHVKGKRLRHTTIDDLAAYYCDQLSLAGLQGPAVFCGFSLGGLVAFEAARQWRQRRGDLVQLFLMEPSSPGAWPDAEAWRACEKLVPRIVRHLRGLRAAQRETRLAYLSEKTRFFVEHLKGWSIDLYCKARLSVGMDVPASLRWHYSGNIYAHAVLRYVPGPFPGKVIVAHGRKYPSNHLGFWSELAGGGFLSHAVGAPGHLDMLESHWMAQCMDLLESHARERFTTEGRNA